MVNTNQKPISEFLEKHFLHFNAASLLDAAKGYENQLNKGAKMLVSMAGAMSTAEIGKIFAEVIRKDNGESQTLAILLPGQIFGEIGYIRETERTADVVAIEDVSVLRFNYERMQKDLKFFPNIVAKLNFNISYILGKRLADMVGGSKGK